MVSKRKNIVIPMDIWELDGYSFSERIVLAEIASFTRKGLPCFATNAHFAELLDMSERNIQRKLQKLEKGFLISVRYEEVEGKTRRILTALHHDKSVTPTTTEVSPLPRQNCHPPHDKTVTRTISSTISMNESTTKGSSLGTDYETVARYFVALAADNHVTTTAAQQIARQFIDYYEAREWRTQRGPITEWKPVALAWWRKAAARIPQRAVKRKRMEEEVRRDIKWHQRRMESYAETKPHLVEAEKRAIETLKRELNT